MQSFYRRRCDNEQTRLFCVPQKGARTMWVCVVHSGTNIMLLGIMRQQHWAQETYRCRAGELIKFQLKPQKAPKTQRNVVQHTQTHPHTSFRVCFLCAHHLMSPNNVDASHTATKNKQKNKINCKSFCVAFAWIYLLIQQHVGISVEFGLGEQAIQQNKTQQPKKLQHPA